MLTIKLPRVIANEAVLEKPEGFNIVRVISRDNDTIIEVEPINVDRQVSDIERALYNAGHPILAIKSYRARTQAGLKDAKEAVEAVCKQW